MWQGKGTRKVGKKAWWEVGQQQPVGLGKGTRKGKGNGNVGYGVGKAGRPQATEPSSWPGKGKAEEGGLV